MKSMLIFKVNELYCVELKLKYIGKCAYLILCGRMKNLYPKNSFLRHKI